MKKIILSLLFFAIFTIQSGICAPVKSTNLALEVTTKDSFILKGTLSYPKTRLSKYPTVVILHSLGYSSDYCTSLKQEFIDRGYAVLTMDFRGHGKSVFYGNYKKVSWHNLKPKAYAKFPADVMAMMNEAKARTKKADFNNWAIIGGDIGANTAVLVADKYPVKPKAIVLFSPSVTFKGLYIPITMTELGQIPILTIASKIDKYSLEQQEKLSRFAQGKFYISNYPVGGMGMMMLKVNPTIPDDVANWLQSFLAPAKPTAADIAKAKARAEAKAKAKAAIKAKNSSTTTK